MIFNSKETRQNYQDLYIFMQVAQAGSFSQAGLQLGMAQSNISRTIKSLEQRLGLPLFHRTTRKLLLTQAGENLLTNVIHSFQTLDHSLNLLHHYKNTPSGTVRINASLHAIEQLLLPKLAQFNEQYPDIRIELINDNRFVDITQHKFDAGIRLGNDVGEEMIAVQISHNMQMAMVATPEHFQQYGFPQTPDDLKYHPCIAYQYQNGELYTWHLQKDGEDFYHHPQGQWVFSDSYAERMAAKLGLGLAYIPLDLVQDEIAHAKLIRTLPDYSMHLEALYLYYPHRHISNALRVVIDYLKITPLY